MRRTRSDCCARAASGQVVVLPTSVRKSRRRIAFPRLGTTPNRGVQLGASEQEIAASEMGSQGQVAMRNLEAPNDRNGSKPEYLTNARMSASTGCGHAVAYALGGFVPIPAVSRCSNALRLLDRWIAVSKVNRSRSRCCRAFNLKEGERKRLLVREAGLDGR
jgi:hypothetical protein